MASVSGDARDSASSFRTNALTLCCLEDVDRLWECTQSRIRNITNTATYSVHFPGIPYRRAPAHARRASAPWRRLCRRWSSICPVCGRGEGSGGRRLRPVRSLSAAAISVAFMGMLGVRSLRGAMARNGCMGNLSWPRPPQERCRCCGTSPSGRFWSLAEPEAPIGAVGQGEKRRPLASNSCR